MNRQITFIRRLVFALLSLFIFFTGQMARAADSSYFVSQSVPTTMYAGRSYAVSVVMRNDGTIWATGRGYRLSSLDPAGNTRWGLSAIDLTMATEQNEDAQFDFTVTAPTSPGVYSFVWAMTRNGVQFGGIASGSNITVIAEGSTAPPGTTPPPDAPPATPTPTPGTTTPAVNMNAVMVAIQMLLEDDTPPVPVVPTTIALASPNAGVAIAPGANASFSMAVGGPGTTAVKMYANGLLIGNAQGSGTAWTFSWLADTPSVYSIVAKAVDANGTVLAASAPVTITVAANTGGSGSSGGTLVPVSITPPHLGNPDAGTLPGALDVSSSGAAVYAIDIVVPPGTNGMQPAMSLNYSGNGLNGLFGLGWSISGLSSVHRCGKTIAQDGVNERINFSHSDRLCLDGQRLILANRAMSEDNYWAVGAQYRTEIESFNRVTMQNQGPNGAISFMVEARDGRISTYGKVPASGLARNSSVAAIVGAVNSGTTAAQPTAKSGPQSWAIDDTVDRYGNYMHFFYQQDGVTGEHRPTFIRYGGVGLTSHAAVEFEYETRQDAWKRYIDESRNDLRSRVKHIRTYVGENLDASNVAASGNLVRDYTLNYEYSPTSGRSLLSTVGVCALHPVSGQTDCIKETKFEWGKPNKAPGFVSRGMWAGAPILTTNNTKGPSGPRLSAANHADYFAFSDFDHDGLTDVLEKRVASMRPSDINTYDGMFREASNPIAPGTLRASYRYFRNVGGSFVTYNYRLSTGENFVALDVGDFNGDGALDLLAYSQSGTRICTSPLATTAPGAAGSTITFQCGALLGGWRNEPGGRAYVFDPLGNGKSAAYTAIADRKARFCTIDECLTDTNPPYVLGLDDSFPIDPFTGLDTFAAVEYNSFVQMADFTGIGKPYDTRWTTPNFQQYTMDGGERVLSNTWNNMDPVITMTSLGRPGDSSGSMAPYTYPTPPGSITPPIHFGYAFDAPYQGNSLTSDFNGSGYTGLAFGYIQLDWYANVASNRSADLTICLSTGRALDCSVRQKYSGSNYHSVSAVGNFVGDGMAAVMTRPLVAVANGRPRPGPNVEMCRVIGDDTTAGTGTADNNMSCVAWLGLQLPEDAPGAAIDQVYFMDLLGTGRTQLVYYHSGDFVGGVWKEDGRWEIYEPIDVAAEGQALDQLVRVTNGIGATSTVEYIDGMASGIVSNTGKTWDYPQQALRVPGKVIKKLTASNGGYNLLSKTYKYFDNANDMLGRGALGYRVIETKDEQTGFITETTFSQTWPMVGMKLIESTKAGTCEISRVEQVTVVTQPFALANGAATVLPLTKNQTSIQKDLACQPLATVTTVNTYGDAWGNITEQVATTVGGGETFKMATAATFFNNESLWLLHLAKHTAVTKTSPTVLAQESRTLDHEYDQSTGALTNDIVEALDTKYRLNTAYIRNGYGLVEQTTQSWTDPAGVSASRTVSDVKYDGHARYPTTIKNALGHAETHEYYPATGVRKSLKDANNLTTFWQVDGFGGIQVETRANGNEMRLYRKECDSACPTGSVMAQITESFHGTARIAVPSVVYSDSAGHVLRTLTWGFDGKNIVSDRRYDVRGRLFEQDRPRFEVAPTSYLETRTLYDDLDRVTLTTSLDELGTPHDSTISYDGFTRTLKNLLGYSRVETRNAIGELKSVKDPNQQLTKFEYEAFGNLSTTTDPNGNITKISYDRLGRKTHIYDPDLGHIEYVVDVIGRPVKQINSNQRAKGQETTAVFDKLDRMTARYETDLESHWAYDTAVMGIGKLAQAYTKNGTIVDYLRQYLYDDLSRQYSKKQNLSDGTYASLTEYDGWSRPFRVSYQRNSGAMKVFENRYATTGYLAGIARGNSLLWNVTGQDAAQRVTDAVLGNGLLQHREYNPYTGRLSGSNLKTTSDVSRLQEGYTYDWIGSLAGRTQIWEQGSAMVSFDETFHNDSLNRIEWSQVQNQTRQNFTYDAIGNLLSKTGVSAGNYVYPQGAGMVRPHGLTSISGLGNFIYDDNGNLLSGNGRTTSWTSFNMPLLVSSAKGSASFVYGPEHQRVRQVRGDGSSVVYGGVQEAETKGGPVTVKTYWPGGLGVEIDHPGVSETEMNYTHVDRLGSIVAITDHNGETREKLAYDAWGKRRTLDGTPVPDDIHGEVDDRGFTGHEMLDHLNLVHMNGRVYDPAIARFMSADPLIQSPNDGQSYNRYSYVLNNPTNLTDPTGFEATAIVEVIGQRLDSWKSYSAYAKIEGIGKDLAKKAAINAPKIGMAVAKFSLGLNLFLISGNAGTPDGAGELSPYLADQARKSALAQKAAMAAVNGDEGKGDKASDALSDGTNSEEGEKQGENKSQDGETGSYTNTHESGKKYHGKGDRGRSQESGREKDNKNGDPHTSTDWTPAENDREAFKQESRRLKQDGGHRSDSNYNRRDSPGTKYIKQDGF
jgi:RHS repeat-associated protein